MKQIAVLFGRERTFPEALIGRIEELGHGVVKALPAVVDGETLEQTRPYDLVVDRISHDFAFYRAVLAKYAVDGVPIVPAPAGETSHDRFACAVAARNLGVAVPRLAVLPSREHPEDITPESLTNLRFPIDWQRIFDYVGFPAELVPLDLAGSEMPRLVRDVESFFDAYGETGSQTMVLEESLVGLPRYRALVVDGAVRVLLFANGEASRFLMETADETADLRSRIAADARKLSHAFSERIAAFDFSVKEGTPLYTGVPNLRPLATREALGTETFDWFVDAVAEHLVEMLAPKSAARTALETGRKTPSRASKAPRVAKATPESRARPARRSPAIKTSSVTRVKSSKKGSMKVATAPKPAAKRKASGRPRVAAKSAKKAIPVRRKTNSAKTK